ncbi:hypothetical protein CLF_100872 [Clonorchis sinensis]|uniref:Uncharacterized protein n=1 Tax=Clonorchis sinensis TaxID=79923 RepID=G7Y4F9_CLOSI|nr:hypothetical protein CLF_100872 [Clonorchis sinensis]
MTSVFNTDALLSYNHDLSESLIVKKRIKVDEEGTYCCLTTIIPRCLHLQTFTQAIWIETDNKHTTDIGALGGDETSLPQKPDGSCSNHIVVEDFCCRWSKRTLRVNMGKLFSRGVKSICADKPTALHGYFTVIALPFS